MLLSTPCSDFHNTDIPDLSHGAHRAVWGLFLSSEQLWSCYEYQFGKQRSPSHSEPTPGVSWDGWSMFENDRQRLRVVYNERELQEKGSEETARRCAYLSTSLWVTYLLPLRLAGSRLLSKVWLQHCSSNKWKEPLPPVFHECEGVRAFPGQIFHFGPWNMNKRKLSKFCSTLWRCCFGVCLVNMWRMRNQTSYGQQMIFFFFFVLLQLHDRMLFLLLTPTSQKWSMLTF